MVEAEKADRLDKTEQESIEAQLEEIKRYIRTIRGWVVFIGWVFLLSLAGACVWAFVLMKEYERLRLWGFP
jgi:hypothetical protein